MSKDTNQLLNLFGRLFQRRDFVGAVMHGSRIDNHRMHNRGPVRVLRLLKDHDQLTNSDIVEALDIRPSSVSALVAKLEENGLIARKPSEEDGRVMLISLTEKGKNFISEAHDFKSELSESLFSALSTEEQEQLNRLLGKLVADLDENKTNLPNQDRMPEFYGHHHHGHGHGPMGYGGPMGRGGFGFGPRGGRPRQGDHE
ncbi:MarR family winged helix-turn-helix transcriptional regulator [Secundilactobacillus folii]|uniref:MarR family transcriptional regulator n=1 Tax=Secundilactobacillus folii TaxID=2678357 RepID=A0A7X2XWZ7_9LACO|nr:MarR family transcriptional regulator [Secundilactobacillus folii]MTV83198.1 MarR family transcriptional regulator [Secundilactobacillus folii]